MDKQRKIFGGLLIAAGAALAIDRLTATPSPESVAAPAQRAVAVRPVATPSAASPAPAGNAPVATTPSAAPLKPATMPRLSLAARLHAMARDEQLDPTAVPDAFRPSSAWFPAESPANAAARNAAGAGAADPAKVDAAALFRGRHRLTAVMHAGEAAHGLALLEDRAPATGNAKDRTARVGDVVNGYALVSVGKDSARFRSVAEPESEVELAVDRPRGLREPGVASTTAGE